MGSNEIYTIGREFGSLGKQVGQDLAKRLGIKFYDKELLQQAAKESGLCEEIFESHDEKPTNSFLYSLVMDTYTGGSYSTAPFLDMPLNHKVFLAQFDAIKKIAANEPCVIVGRCADYALADEPHCLNIFMRAEQSPPRKTSIVPAGPSCRWRCRTATTTMRIIFARISMSAARKPAIIRSASAPSTTVRSGWPLRATLATR